MNAGSFRHIMKLIRCAINLLRGGDKKNYGFILGGKHTPIDTDQI